MIKIVIDSAANVPPELIERHNLVVIPLKVLFGTDTFREGIDLDEDDFFSKLEQANPLPTTSQPTPHEFEEVYRPLLEEGHEIISIHLSSDLSGTYNAARNGAEAFPDAPLSIVDTRSVSAGTALLVLAAARMVEAGRSRQEIVARLEEMAPQGMLALTVDTLENLRRGGRIGGAQALIGGLLNFKPLILIKEGKLNAGGRVRSRKKALDALVTTQVERYGDQSVWVGLAEARASDIAELEKLARERLNVKELVHCKIGPVVATHGGPGVIGIIAIPEPSL